LDEGRKCGDGGYWRALEASWWLSVKGAQARVPVPQRGIEREREYEEVFAGDDFGGVGVGGRAAGVGRLQYVAEFDEAVSGAGEFGSGQQRAGEVTFWKDAIAMVESTASAFLLSSLDSEKKQIQRGCSGIRT
jgi:hypothetical protein